MVIKVPIYVEIDTVDQRELPKLVGVLMQGFYEILRKEENYNTKTYRYINISKKELSNLSMKIISRDDALESLRTSK